MDNKKFYVRPFVCEGCKHADIRESPSWLRTTPRVEVTCLKRVTRNLWGNQVNLLLVDEFEKPFPIGECKFLESTA